LFAFCLAGLISPARRMDDVVVLAYHARAINCSTSRAHKALWKQNDVALACLPSVESLMANKLVRANSLIMLAFFNVPAYSI
jgi:hypothetical protein